MSAWMHVDDDELDRAVRELTDDAWALWYSSMEASAAWGTPGMVPAGFWEHPLVQATEAAAEELAAKHFWIATLDRDGRPAWQVPAVNGYYRDDH